MLLKMNGERVSMADEFPTDHSLCSRMTMTNSTYH